MNQTSTFQIKPIPFQVTEHLIDLHSTTIGPQGLLLGGKMGDPQPWVILALFPMGQPVRWAPVCARQRPLAQPPTLTGLPNPILEAPPLAAGKPNPMAGFLPQDIPPSSQLPDDPYSAELPIAHLQDRET
jgi:hypothetical protein